MTGLVNAFQQGVNIEQSINSENRRQAAFEQAQTRNQAIDDHMSELRPLELAQAKRENEFQEKIQPYQLDAAKDVAELASMQNDAEKQKYNANIAKNLFPMVKQALVESGGDVEAVSRRFPAYFEATKGMNNALNFQFAMKPETANAYQVMKKIVDPNTPDSFASSTEALGAVNLLLRDQVNRGGGVNPSTGLPITQREIVGIYQHPQQHNKLAFDLKVTDKGGNTYIAPRTENASSDADDLVKMVDVNALLDQLYVGDQLTREVQTTAQQNPNFMQQLNTAYDTEALNQQLALAEKQFFPSTKKGLKAGFMPWGNTSISVGDAISLYEQSLPNADTNPDLNELHRSAMPFEYFSWAQGDADKMAVVTDAKNDNIVLYRNYAQAMAEAQEDEDYPAMRRAKEQFLSKLRNPISEWQQKQNQANTAQVSAERPTAQSPGLSMASQRSKPVEQNEPELKKPAAPMSWEDFQVYDAGKHPKKTEQERAFSQAISGMSGIKRENRTTEERYEDYLDDYQSKVNDYNAQMQRNEMRQRLSRQRDLQQKINALNAKLEVGEASETEKEQLKTLVAELRNTSQSQLARSDAGEKQGFFDGLKSMFGFDQDEPEAKEPEQQQADIPSSPGLNDLYSPESPYHESRINKSQANALALYQRGYTQEQAIKQIKAMGMSEPAESRLIKEISEVYEYANKNSAQNAGLAQYTSHSTS